MPSRVASSRRGARWNNSVRATFFVLLTTSCSAASCQNSGFTAKNAAASMGARSGRPDLGQYVTWDRDITFTDSAASGTIQVFFEPSGGFIVADAGQAQVRTYSDSAKPVWVAGRRGEGPGEFQQVKSAVRTSREDVVALDNTGRITVFDPSGKVRNTASTGLSPAYNSWLINDTTLLISGRFPGDSGSPLLHVWDLTTHRIVRSFFTVPPHDRRFDEAYRFSGWANAALLGGDSLAVVFPLADTLYLYRTDGTEIDKLKLPLDNFRRLREAGPRNDSPEATVEWRNSYTRLSQVMRSPDGSLYIQYFNLRGYEPIWGISRFLLDKNGLHKRFEVNETPRLLGISPRDSSLYFLRADLMESTVWSIAHAPH